MPAILTFQHAPMRHCSSAATKIIILRFSLRCCAEKSHPPCGRRLFSFPCDGKSALGNSFVGANLRTAAAADARIRVDVIDIALRDSLYGAYGLAGAAGHAVVADYISHSKSVIRVVNYSCCYSLLAANLQKVACPAPSSPQFVTIPN